MIVLHSAGASSRASCACHVPTTGDTTSANQKYGGPPCRSCDLAATLPFGAISENSPSSGLSVANITRKGAPFQGAIGEVKTASSVASSQLSGTWACELQRCENRDQRCPDNQQQGCHSKRQLTHEKQLSPRPSKLVLLNHGKN